jgi:hypothetical protein
LVIKETFQLPSKVNVGKWFVEERLMLLTNVKVESRIPLYYGMSLAQLTEEHHHELTTITGILWHGVHFKALPQLVET